MTAGVGPRVVRDRVIAGDGLRAVAALTVLAYHVALCIAGSRYHGLYASEFGLFAAHVFRALNGGLFVFFALSGYLITRGFARNLVLGARRPRLPAYASRRALRIVPAFWVALTASLLIRGTWGSGPGEVAAMYGFAQIYVVGPVFNALPPAWTLDIEVAFYAAVPLLALAALPLTRRVASARWRALLLLAGLACLAGASAAWLLAAQPQPWESLPHEFFVAFAPGVALAIVEPVVAGRITPRPGAVIALLLGLSAIAVFVVMSLEPPLALGTRALLSSVGSGALLGALLVRQWANGTAPRLLNNGVMRWLGVRSYGIYLWHYVLVAQLWRDGVHLRSAWLTFAVLGVATLAASCAAAELSWRFVEAPALRLKTRITPWHAAAVGVKRPTPSRAAT